MQRKRQIKHAVKHGAKRRSGATAEYRAWSNIKDRCYNGNHSHYENYGGRGITMHMAWKHDFAAFLAGVGPRPSPKHTLDRFPDNDGNYEPGNIRWATRAEQNRNTRRTRLITFNGETLCLKDWAERIGVARKTLRARLNMMPIETALTMQRWDSLRLP